jgi:hypothetical protein
MNTQAKPKACHGKTLDAMHYARCMTCEHLKPDAESTIVPTWTAGYMHGVVWVNCLDHEPKRHGSTVDRVTPEVCGQNVSTVTNRKRALFVLGALALVAVSVGVSVAAHAAPVCQWPEPGLNPYTGDKAAAVRRLVNIPASEREELARMVSDRTWQQQVEVTRDKIGGGRYTALRNMNFGADGRICVGDIDRSMWPADRVERALIYQVGPHAVAVFSACGNVAQVSDTQYKEPRPTVLQTIRGAVGVAPASQVPEPGTWALAVLALAGVALSRGRK